MHWFKHYSNATSSLKLSQLIAQLGAEGYGFYWLFLELISSKFDGSLTPIVLHFDEVLTKFRLNNCRKMVRFANVLNELSLIEVKTSGKLLTVNPSILVRLKQKDFKIEKPKGLSLAPNSPLELEENKELEIEEKKKAPAPSEVLKKNKKQDAVRQEYFAPDSVVKIWNKLCVDPKKQVFFLGNNQLRECDVLIGFLKTPAALHDYFQRALASSFLTTQFNLTLPWLVNTNNAAKVLSGQYDDLKSESDTEAKAPSDEEMESLVGLLAGNIEVSHD